MAIKNTRPAQPTQPTRPVPEYPAVLVPSLNIAGRKFLNPKGPGQVAKKAKHALNRPMPSLNYEHLS